MGIMAPSAGAAPASSREDVGAPGAQDHFLSGCPEGDPHLINPRMSGHLAGPLDRRPGFPDGDTEVARRRVLGRGLTVGPGTARAVSGP